MSAVRVCAVTDVQCSRNCGDVCKLDNVRGKQMSEINEPTPKQAQADHVQRMRSEYEVLEQRTTNLNKFIKSSPVYKTLDPEERLDMCEQFMYMDGYRKVLKQRIDRADAKGA